MSVLAYDVAVNYSYLWKVLMWIGIGIVVIILLWLWWRWVGTGETWR